MEGSSLFDLQPDMIVQILHKLPLQSLLQCKLVCKQWYSLITDGLFKSNYNTNSIPGHPLTVLMIPRNISTSNERKRPGAVRYEIDGSDNCVVGRSQTLPRHSSEYHKLALIGSWNGLVALCNPDKGDFHLFNPYTGEHEAVHVTDDLKRGSRPWYNPLYGLCYDSFNNDYKVVFSYCIPENDLCVVSFKNGGWKLKTGPGNIEYCLFGHSGTVVNGIPHWFVSRKYPWRHSIFYFDQQEEEFHELPLPNQWRGEETGGLGSLDGQLSVLGPPNNEQRGTEVWVLKVYGDVGTWTCLLKITNAIHWASPVSMITNHEILLDVRRRELMIYNYESHTIRQLQPKMKRKFYEIITFMPSLVSPNSEKI